MTRPHPLLNKDYQRLSQIFDYIASVIGGKLERNSTSDERGLTDVLLDLLQTNLNKIKLGKYYINLEANKPSEKKTGADILFRIVINEKEISFDRYVLLQAKKYLARSGQFNETNISNAHLLGQVAKMQSYNAEFSYLLLYSTISEPNANSIILQTPINANLILNFDSNELVMFSNQNPLTLIQNNYPVAILRSKTWERFTDINPENLLNYSDTFSNFLLDNLITGKVGKDWDTTIENAQGEFSIVVTLTIGQG